MNRKTEWLFIVVFIKSGLLFSQGFYIQAMPQESYQMQITPIKTTFQYGGGLSLGWEWKRYQARSIF